MGLQQLSRYSRNVRVLVTGGAGFIGSNVVDALLARGYNVRAIDNLSTGTTRFLEDASSDTKFELQQLDLLNFESLSASCRQIDLVIHLAANADVRFGWNHPRRDLEQNIVATQNLLEAMRRNGVQKLIFSSTGSVYGDATIIPTPEDAPFPVQTSLYGASKLSAEAMIAAYATAGHLSATVFRFVSILGPRYTHGHVIDFVAQLQQNPLVLKVLGNGQQRKSYLHVSDCVAALMLCMERIAGFKVLNLGHDDYCTVHDSARWIAESLDLRPQMVFGNSVRGWVGDNSFIHLDNSKIRSLGWAPTCSIRDSITDTVAWLMENKWALHRAVLG
jgi:UDP-glucose 4-epimerase